MFFTVANPFEGLTTVHHPRPMSLNVPYINNEPPRQRIIQGIITGTKVHQSICAETSNELGLIIAIRP